MIPCLTRKVQARSIPQVVIIGFSGFCLSITGTGASSVSRALGSQVPPQSSAPVSTPTSQTVTLDLYAADAKGNPITDLTADQLTLDENGRAQKITDLSLVKKGPLFIAFFFDTSGSRKHDPLLKDEIVAAHEFLLTVWRDGSLGAVSTFTDQVQVLAGPTAEVQGMFPALDSIPTAAYRGSSAVYDAICTFTPQKLSSFKGRKSVIVLSDFQDDASRNSSKKTFDYISASAVRVFPVVLHEQPLPASEKSAAVKATKDAEKFAQASGGKSYEPRASADVQSAFQNLASILENSYTVTYAPEPSPTPNKQRAIKIQSLRQDVKSLSYPQGIISLSN